ncbi:MAG: DUF1684 domain-containing protein [Rhodanobacter sp.]
MLRSTVLALALFGVVAMSAAEPAPDAYAQSLDRWRQERLQKLTAPDGWLSLVGLAWLARGANTIGSAADNAIVVAGAPARLGVITFDDDGTVRIALAPGSDARVDGKEVLHATLVDDVQAGAGTPTQVSFGTTSLYVIDREGRKGLRIKDPQSPTRTGFLGIDSFPVDPSWRIDARWVPAAPGRTLEMGTVIGTTEKYPVPGTVEFSRDGHTFALLPVIEVPGDEQYFIVFADRTSGKETYGAARFLYIDPPRDGSVVIDFNRAYNPPCAFTAFATCPLAPPENRLDLRVTAGERNYRGAAH